MSEPGVVRVNQSGLGIGHQEAAADEVQGRSYGPGLNLGEVCRAAGCGIVYIVKSPCLYRTRS